MRFLTTFALVVSLAVNAVLIAAFFTDRASAKKPVARMEPTPSPAPPAGPTLTTEAWQKLRSDTELPAMVQRLRDQGFPPDVIRAIMASHLRELYAARMKALDPGSDSRPYWKNMSIDPRVVQAQQQLYREQRKVLRELLGADAEPAENINDIYQGRRYDGIPPEKVADIRRLQREFEEARSDIFINGGLMTSTPETQRKIRELEQAQKDALAQLLTPAEFEAYNLRNSDTARQLRNNLVGFNPTEQEFQTLFKLQAEYDSRFGGPMFGPSTQEEMRQRGEAQRQLNEQIKAALGPQRAEEYARTTDYSYRQASQLVARLELPPETTSRIWEVKQDVEQRSMALRRDRSLSDEDRNKQLTALVAETNQKLSPLLGGQRGLEAFKQYGGYWYTNLTPRPPSPAVSGGEIRVVPARE